MEYNGNILLHKSKEKNTNLSVMEHLTYIALKSKNPLFLWAKHE